jgi:hypothetical protein
MDISQLETPAVYAPSRVFACTVDTHTRTIAWDIRPDVDLAVVIPGNQEVVAFDTNGAVTFQCTAPSVMNEVLIGLGFCKNTLDVPNYLTDPASPLQYILEKP